MSRMDTVVVQVRKRHSDYNPNDRSLDTFDDTYYEDAVYLGLSRLNSDTRNAYTVTSIPTNREFLLVNLATIEMLTTRVALGAATSSGNAGALKAVATDGLKVEYSESTQTQAKDWNRLLQLLESQYQKWLSQNAFDIPEVADLPKAKSFTMHKGSSRLGGAYRSYEMDRGIEDPISDLSVSVSGSTVTLSWTQVYHTQFRSYKILISDDEGSTFDLVTTITDNHVFEYEHEDVSVGEYIYKIQVVSLNGIKTYSNEVEIEVV